MEEKATFKLQLILEASAFKLQSILEASATRYQYGKALQTVNTSIISAYKSKCQAQRYLSLESWSMRGPCYNICLLHFSSRGWALCWQSLAVFILTVRPYNSKASNTSFSACVWSEHEAMGRMHFRLKKKKKGEAALKIHMSAAFLS